MDGGLTISAADFETGVEELVLLLSCDNTWELEKTSEGSMLKHKALVHRNNQTYCTQVHVLYDQAYAVPVLFFICWLPNGRLASLEEVCSTASLLCTERLHVDPLTVITQKEHPVLGKPWYYIHPCKTAKLLSKIRPANPLSYMTTWLSIMAPLSGITLPVELFAHVARTTQRAVANDESTALPENTLSEALA